MRDLFLVHTSRDEPLARGYARSFDSGGLELGEAVTLWPKDRLVKLVDQGLHACRHAVVLVTDELLRCGHPRQDLDVLAARPGVIALLCGVDERDLRARSTKLAVVAIPERFADRIVVLIRRDD